MRVAIKALTITAIWATSLTTNLFADDTQDLYKAKCQMCHGAEGQPSSIGKSMGAKAFNDPEVVKMSDADLAGITSNGKNKMPAYKGKISDDQINALVKYVRTLK